MHAGVVKNALNAPPNNELHWSPLESHTLPETSHERPTSPRQYPLPLALETQTIARACGKSHVHNLEPEDLVALTIEAAAMARVPLAGTGWIPGSNGF